MKSSQEANHLENATCWHQMFRNPTIAYGYPIPARRHGDEGLEVSLAIMALLGAAPRIIHFGQTLFLKGFCSLFVPMIRIGQSVIWHYLLQADGQRISYNCGLALERNCNDLTWSTLQESRHFVGWTPSAKITAGTKEANYDVRLSSSKYGKQGLATLKNINISAGYMVTCGANFAPAKKDISVTIAESRPYEQQMDAAREMLVNFYDTDTQKGWLLDGATALLHLCRGWLSSEYASSSCSAEAAIKKFTDPSTFDGGKASQYALNLEANRSLELYSRKSRTTDSNPTETKWCWEQLVEQKWLALEKIHDYIEGCSKASWDLPSGFHSHTLEGFEFVDILSNKPAIKLKTVNLDSDMATWLSMTKDNGENLSNMPTRQVCTYCTPVPSKRSMARRLSDDLPTLPPVKCVVSVWQSLTSINYVLGTINIFGSGFGDLIVPASSPTVGTAAPGPSTCGQHLPVPEGNEYLTAPLYVLQKIAQNYDEREDGSVALSDTTHWTVPSITKCPSACKNRRKCLPSLARLEQSSVAQLGNMLQSLGRKRKACPKPDIFQTYPNGAVIFGNGMKMPSRKPRKRRQNFGDDSTRAVRMRTSDSGIDMGSSSASQDVSSSNRSQSPSASGDSGVYGSQSGRSGLDGAIEMRWQELHAGK